MPFTHAFAILLGAILMAGVATTVLPRLRNDLRRPVLWTVIGAAACAGSGLSALVARTRHSGTGFTTDHGWPKPFHFRYLSETGERTDGWSLVHFLGNAGIYLGVALIAWTLWRSVRR